jgi:hypothetical protein
VETFECEICGNENLEELETYPTFETVRGERVLVVHGHYQLASYDHGRRVAEELATIEIAECVALGAPISEEDRARYLGDNLPSFEDFEHWEFVFETADNVAANLPDGFVSLNSADAGTWTLWAIDRDAFERALATYAGGSANV